MNVIFAALKAFFLSIMGLMAPYTMNALIKVAVPVMALSLQAVLSGDPNKIAQAKAEIKDNWAKFVDEARATSIGTPSKIDDVIFGYLNNIEVDDVFVGQIFDLAVKLEKQLFRIS